MQQIFFFLKKITQEHFIWMPTQNKNFLFYFEFLCQDKYF